jgi:hypothetical protein
MSRAFSCSTLSLAATALMLGACLDHPLKPVEYDKSEEAENTVAIAINKDVDILFVIDNSGSMAEEQELVAANFKAFIDVLEAPDVKANYRIGITTTDAGNPRCPNATYKPENGNLVLSSCVDRIDQGEFSFNSTDYSAACVNNCSLTDADISVRPTKIAGSDAEEPRKWIENIEGQSNITGVSSNVEAFQCFGPQGVAGCGFESHLESMYKALAAAKDKNSKNNYGFLREAAILSIVFLTDEADCSSDPDAKAIFLDNKVFWNSPDDPAPTSALCWRAGVSCTGSSPFDACRSENYDIDGNPGAAADAAVLFPVQKYIDFVQNIENDKKMIDQNQEVLVALIAGVPIGYEDFTNELIYEDSADMDYMANFGIGPGCIIGDPNAPTSTAVPPVREREFAEAFDDDKTDKSRNLFSICQDNYSAALEAIADKIRDQIKPACMPNCVRDTDENKPGLNPNCNLYQVNLADDSSQAIVQCQEVNGAWTAPAGETVCFATLTDKNGMETPSGIDNMSPECVDEGFNLEFILVRSAAAPAGTTITAACELSENKKRDCPKL